MSISRWLGPLLVVGGISYLFLSSPSSVVVELDGSVGGLINQARLGFQGHRFWQHQQQKVKEELLDLYAEPGRMRAQEQEFEKMFRELDQSLAESGRSLSPAEKRAEQLRDQAASIEQAELNRMLDRFRRERIAELKRIERQVNAHLSRDDHA